MRFRLMAGTVFSTVAFAAMGAAQAQSAPVEAAGMDDQVTVTATRTEKRVDEVPATVTVITEERMENELVTDIKDLVRFEPGVSVSNSPARFGAALGATGRDGNAGFNIRGLEGNRVLIQVDGVRVPDAYSFGPQANGRGGYVDLDLLKSVEILRGPASALYGSDGIAGAVSFITRDPDDLVQEGRTFGVRARTAYASADDSWANSVIGATEFGDWSGMLSYTRRDAHEQENQGETGGTGESRTLPNPTESQSDSWLAKLVWAPGDMHRFRLTYEGLEGETVTQVLSGLGTSPFTGQSTLALDATDTTERERFAFDHIFDLGDGGFLTGGRWGVYTQDSHTRQFTFEDRDPAVDRTRDNTFDTSVWGVSGQIEAAATTGAVEHTLLLGADWSETEQSNIRDGTVPPFGETFPVRTSPLTEYTLTGIFLQDEISILDGQLLLYPAVRYDAYELTPIRDAFYPANFPAEPSDGDQVSPKLGIVAWPSDWLGAYANFAKGYKAPAPGQVNEGFENLAFGYTTIANPDLKPESSDSSEVGVRLRDIGFAGAEWSGSVAAYVTDAKDFIVNQAIGGAGTPSDPVIFQYINLTQVSIDGVEAQLNAAWDNGFGLRLAASKSDGTVKGAPNEPLQSIDPAKLVAGLTYDDPQGRFGGQLIATFVDGKDIGDVVNPTDFRPPSFSILDLTAYWNITEMVALRAGAFNLTDEKYWWWSDVRGLASNAVALDAFTQPGRNYSASLTFRY
jgi:hemoglobin/transferrin/lactoferrin receptor protein